MSVSSILAGWQLTASGNYTRAGYVLSVCLTDNTRIITNPAGQVLDKKFSTFYSAIRYVNSII